MVQPLEHEIQQQQEEEPQRYLSIDIELDTSAQDNAISEQDGNNVLQTEDTHTQTQQLNSDVINESVTKQEENSLPIDEKNNSIILAEDDDKYTFTPMWNLDSISGDIKRQILQFIPFAVIQTSSPNQHVFLTWKKQETKPTASLMKWNSIIFPLRLISKSWQETMDESLCDPMKHYLQLAEQSIPKHQMPTKKSNLNSFAQQIEYLAQLKQTHKMVCEQNYKLLEKSRIKSNFVNILRYSTYSVWKTMATFIYICLVVFFLLQTLFNIIQWCLPQFDSYLQHVSFLTVAPLLLCFFSVPVFFLMVSIADNSWKGCRSKRVIRNHLIGFCVPMIIPIAMNSFILLYVINLAILNSISVPSAVGRMELLPWPVVFSPLIILFSIVWLGMLGLCIYLFADNCKRNRVCREGFRNRETIVAFLSFVLISCVFAFIITVSICMEIPNYLNPAYAYIFMFLFQILFFILSIETIVYEKKNLYYVKNIVPVNSILPFIPFTFFINHILACIASFGLLPMAIVYLEILVPFTLFFIWIQLRLAERGVYYGHLQPPTSVKDVKNKALVQVNGIPKNIFDRYMVFTYDGVDMHNQFISDSMDIPIDL